MTIAIVRVRGVHGVTHRIRYALDQMHLTRKNHCVLMEKPDPRMLQQIRDYTTWGEASKETIAALQARNPKAKENAIAVYRLNNPKGGWKDTKNHYPQGDLGNRGEKINELIKKMLH